MTNSNLIVSTAVLCALAVIRFDRVDALSMSAGGPHFVGFDLGTSGARVSVIERATAGEDTAHEYKEIYSKAILWEGAYNNQDAWMDAVDNLLRGASKAMGSLESVASICVSGTSASCLMVDSKRGGDMTRKPRMYDFDVANRASDPVHAHRALELLDQHAPPRHTARANTGSLAKLLTWNEEKPLQPGEVLCHQSDYITMKLLHNKKKCGSGPQQKRVIRSDWHNCLKLGYDVQNLEWPSWIEACLADAGISDPLGAGVVPVQVVSPGEPIGTISEDVAKEYGLSPSAVVVGGTTDSNAAFFAAVGASPDMGTAVTSLGSTLAMKKLSATYVEDASRGIYSHRFPSFANEEEDTDGEAWLVGGASNVGCAVLRQLEFSNDELQSLSNDIDPSSDSPLSYYPLTKKGERFPVADSEKEPILEPIPSNRGEYLHGILQGISDVERDGFIALGELGATPSRPGTVWTCGGGSRNDMWMKMRERRLIDTFEDDGIQVMKAENTEASFGAAILAAATFK